MDIAALSFSLNQSRLMQSVGVSLLDKSMNQIEVQAQQLISMMETAAPAAPPSGHQLDIRI